MTMPPFDERRVFCNIEIEEVVEGLLNITDEIPTTEKEILETFQFAISDSCGIFGTCVDNECVCDQPWTRSPEYDFYEEDPLKRGLLCDTHPILLQVLYGMVSILGLLILLWFSFHWRRWTDYRLISIQMLSIVLLMTYSIWRLVEVEQRLIGIDTSSSVLFHFGCFFFYISAWLFLYRYILFQLQKLPEHGGLSHHRARQLYWIHLCVLVIQLAVSISFSVTTIVPPEKQRVVLIITNICFLFVVSFLMMSANLLLGTLIKDMEMIIERHTKESISFYQVFANEATDSVVLIKLKHSLPGIKKLKLTFVRTCFVVIIAWLPIFFSPTIFRASKYITPFFMMVIFISAWLIERLNQLLKQVKKTKSKSLKPRQGKISKTSNVRTVRYQSWEDL